MIVGVLLLAQPAENAQFIPESVIPPTITRDAEIIPTGETNAICVGNTGTTTPSITLCSTVDLTSKTLLFKLPEYTVGTLPASHALSIVTDGQNASDCTTGKGSTRSVCHWNGSAWASIGGTGGGTGDVTDVLATTNEICVANPAGPQPVVSLCPTIVTTGKTVQLGRTDLASIISPPQLTAQTDSWNPTGLATASTIRITSNDMQIITGIQGGAAGRILTLWNAGSYPIVLANETTSPAPYRFSLGSDLTLGPSQAIMLQYDNTSARWRALGGVGGGSPKYCISTTGTDSYACNLSPAILGYTVGEHYFFHADVANTAAAGKPSLALNGLASHPITKPVGGVTTALATNDIRVSQIVEVVYDGTYFQMLSQVGNSPTGVSGLTTGKISQAASATSLSDSALTEDADSINSTKSLEVGDVSTNSYEWIGTGVAGHLQMKFTTARTKTVSWSIEGAALADSTITSNIWENTIAAMHVTQIKCRTDTGTATINVRRNDGSPVDILSAALTCTTSGATSTSFTSGEDAIAVGYLLDSSVVNANATGSPTSVLVTVNMTVDSGS